jgi:hypothetical protein
MSVPNQENERSCICVLEISLLRLSANFLFQLCGIFQFSLFQNCLQTLRLNQIYIYNTLTSAINPKKKAEWFSVLYILQV